VWLRVLSGADAGRTVEVPAEGRAFVLGRVRGCDLVIRDEGASRHHAEVRAEPAGGLRVRDLGSANGTFVDGRRVEEAMLSGGEELQIAGVEIAVLAHAPEAQGGGGEAVPTWSVVGRLVDHRTRGARRATWVALGAAGLALAAVAFVLLLGGGENDRSVPQVVKRLAPSTVLVEALRGDRRTATGSGWVLDAREGLVVTAAHVVNEGTRYRVAVNGKARPAKLVGSAPCEDLALLRVAGTSGLRDAPLGKGSGVEQGETVVALGFPASAAPTDKATSTRGVVSSENTTFRDPSPDVPAYREAVQTDTALNPGYSGGPLADLEGRLIGVNAAARTTGSDGRPLQGQNYAIGIDRARRVLAELRRGRSASWTGATFGYPTTEELLQRRLPPGLYVTGAVPGTPAARARLGGQGDLLAGIDGRPLSSSLSSYCAAVAGRPGGRGLKLTLARPGGRTREVSVALA
jgi:S1-C subfamily serine protease